jgi:hypothetical protein
MSAKKIHIPLIILTALIFSLSHLFIQKYWIVLISLIMGILWILVEIYKLSFLPYIFFVGFIGLAIYGSQHGLPAPLMLFGLCADLAVWDLSRFQARIRGFTTQSPGAEFTKKHLVKLTLTICLGYILALIPLYIQFSINFGMVIVLTLLILFALRKSMLALRNEKTRIEN